MVDSSAPADTSATGTSARAGWAAQIAALEGDQATASLPPKRRTPITVARIVATAFEIVEAEGYDALTMRRVAAALQTGPASLYAHVRNKAELDDLLIGQLCREIDLPMPDPDHWQEQLTEVCRQLRDQYLRYPGISQASFSARPHSLETVRVSEGMLAILVAGGVAPQTAAWAIDAMHLYVSAYCFEVSVQQRAGDGVDQRLLDRAEIVERFQMLPSARFPITVAYAHELTSGEGHDRFNFTLDLLLGGLARDRS